MRLSLASLSLSLSLTHTHTRSPSPSPSLSLTHSISLSLSLSLVGVGGADLHDERQALKGLVAPLQSGRDVFGEVHYTSRRVVLGEEERWHEGEHGRDVDRQDPDGEVLCGGLGVRAEG